MPKCLLVHGCGQVIHSQRDSETTLRAINLRLTVAAYRPISPVDFMAVHIADVFDGQAGDHRRTAAATRQVARQVYNFVTDAALRIRAMETVARAVDGETRIVVAHSLGSVTAYDALCLLPRHNVSLFVTLGSPLAIPRYVQGRLSAFSAHGRYAWPRTLARWLNFFDYRDPVALRRLQRHFGDGRQIEDRSIYLAPKNPHQLAAYLASHDVISALGEALRLGATSPATGRRA